MGCSSSSLQRMQPPRTVEELAALVVLSRDTALEESIRANTWTQAFYESLQDKELKLIFVFLVLVVSLEKNKEKEKQDKERQEQALFEIQNRVFSNNRTGIANIRFRDTENSVEEIFRLAVYLFT